MVLHGNSEITMQNSSKIGKAGKHKELVDVAIKQQTK